MVDSHKNMSTHVRVKSGDCKIWDAGIAGVEIGFKLAKHQSVVIDLLTEAPAIETTPLVNMLEWLASNGVSHDQIEIHTGNVLETYDRFAVIKHPEWMFELRTFQEQAHLISSTKNITKHFGCLIGRSNINRLILASHLWCNYRNQTLLTYHFNPGEDFHREHLGLEDIIYYFGINSKEFEEAITLLKQGPLLKDSIDTYPIINHSVIKNPCQWYQDFFIDIVCETFSNGQVFFVTEKFWRAVITKTPFIIQGAQHTLSRLKQLGFKTFDRWWDEGYDEDPYLYSVQEIKKVLHNISKLTIVEINAMYKDMTSVLDHNYNVMMNLTYENLASVK